jgi:mRNA interferase MazF
MKRGDVVTVAASGDYGKPRPAVIVQGLFRSDR